MIPKHLTPSLLAGSRDSTGESKASHGEDRVVDTAARTCVKETEMIARRPGCTPVSHVVRIKWDISARNITSPDPSYSIHAQNETLEHSQITGVFSLPM
jgi:hypothetical protein